MPDIDIQWPNEAVEFIVEEVRVFSNMYPDGEIFTVYLPELGVSVVAKAGTHSNRMAVMADVIQQARCLGYVFR